MHTLAIFLHIIGAAIMFGVIFSSIILSFIKTFDPTWVKIFGRIRSWGAVAAIWQILTGLYLYFSNPEEFRDNRIFWIKIIIFALDGVVAVLIIDRLFKKAIKSEQSQAVVIQNLTFWCMVSLVILLTIFYLGVVLTVGH